MFRVKYSGTGKNIPKTGKKAVCIINVKTAGYYFHLTAIA